MDAKSDTRTQREARSAVAVRRITARAVCRWNARGLVLVRRIPQAQRRREDLPSTRLRRVPRGKQRLRTRRSPAWRKVRSTKGPTYIVDHLIPSLGASVEPNSVEGGVILAHLAAADERA